jgi:hypothetical protein
VVGNELAFRIEMSGVFISALLLCLLVTLAAEPSRAAEEPRS